MTTINAIPSELPGFPDANGIAGRLKPQAGQDARSGPSVFEGFLNAVNELQTESSNLETRMYEGQPVDLHAVMIAAEEAGTAVELLAEIRNRLVDTYQELMRMQI